MLVAAVKMAVQAALTPLVARLSVLEARQPIAGLDGRDGLNGKDADPVLMQAAIEIAVTKAVAALPVPRDGKDGKDGAAAPAVDLDLVAQKAAALIPVPKDGERGEKGDRGADAPPPDLNAIAMLAASLIPKPKDGGRGDQGEKGDPGPRGADAPSPDLDAIAAKVVALMPVPRDGTDGTNGRDGTDGKDGKDGRDAEAPDLDAIAVKAASLIPTPKDGKDGTPGRNGLDGVGVTDAVLTKDGTLTLVFSNGTTRTLGSVMGPKGADGLNGRDGVDGLGFVDLTESFDQDTKMFVREYRRGDEIKRFEFPMAWLRYRGTYESGPIYQPGDCVTRGGSLWHANAATRAVPGDGARDWTLIAKRGGEGKPGPQGPKGEPGRDHPAWFDSK